ncbi:unnamed protein product [Didymodactylos carnosus]|uniref:EGF-like domain-containing protein n=1 Tax=Didymodactylos carnosus TaxID=1234261 RepID=A0A815NR87_9BILA|nr:unnamed protein product [Didymodactylos carnosus]CAF1441080.1 unnamed protein product [Didymodactylos carnosus]CAF4173709.1 unnamed protein product [Didymodactylos carnosus]CAF4317232.1 unnamed protein product [Didymodactylos carnosus]
MFCDLFPSEKESKKSFSIDKDFIQYPIRDELITYFSRTSLSKAQVNTKVRSFRKPIRKDVHYGHYCNRGIVVTSADVDGDLCLCPPSYFGDRCQYQARRLTAFIKIEIVNRFRNHIFTLWICLINQNDVVVTCDYISHSYHSALSQHAVYLLYRRAQNHSDIYFVQVIVYNVTATTVSFHSSLLYPVEFQFLPVNRLSALVQISNKNSITDCQKCVHGQCVTYSNFAGKEHCLCNDGWSGITCDIESTRKCEHGSIAVDGQCLCTLGFMGPSCSINRNACTARSCYNGGSCVPLADDFSFTCLCHNEFFGNQCKHKKATLTVHINDKPGDNTIAQVPIIVIHFVNIDDSLRQFSLESRLIFRYVPFYTVLTMFYKQEMLPPLIYAQLLYDTSAPDGVWYLIGFRRRVPTLTTSVLSTNECPHVRELLNSTIMNEFSYLKRVKFYQRSCYILGIKCFRDDRYMCLCDNYAEYDCIPFDRNATYCDDTSYCMNGGRCIQLLQIPGEQFDFGCVCRRCYYGELCQFTTAQYSISLDALIGPEILMDQPVRGQSLIVKITLGIIILMLVLGSAGNMMAILIFSSKKLHDIGCGLYLLSASITSQLGLLAFGARFFYIF